MTSVGEYLLLDRLAVGGMAEIFRAKSMGIEGFEKIVAIKRILPALALDAEFVQMFVEEAKIAGRLRHANIARIFELGKMDNVYFIAMEYIFGKDLKQIFREVKLLGTRIRPPMASWIALQILAGLDYAHRTRGADGRSLRLIHRDVSPQNILVSHDGLVKLIDFGIAKAASRATQTVAGVIKGKLAYMSPEQITGRELDHRSDIFAASTVLHEMLTGERLFGGGTDIEIIDRVREAVARPPSAVNPDVPADLDAIVMKGLAKRPDDRWDTAGDMQEALMGYVARTKPPFSTSRLAEWMRVTFADEIASERAHLEHLSEVAKPGVPVAMGDTTAPTISPDPFDDESTIQTIAAEPSEEFVELSSLVMVEELVGEFEDPGDVAPPPEAFAPTPPVRQPPGEPPPPEASASEAHASIPLARESAPLDRVLHQTPAPIEPPRFTHQPATPAHAPEEEEGGIRWGLLFLVAILSLLLGVGGLVAALYFMGYPLPLPI